MKFGLLKRLGIGSKTPEVAGMDYSLDLFANSNYALACEMDIPKKYWMQSLLKVQRKFPNLKKVKAKDYEEIFFPSDAMKMLEKKMLKSSMLSSVLSEERRKKGKLPEDKTTATLSFVDARVTSIKIRMHDKGKNHRAYVTFEGIWSA